MRNLLYKMHNTLLSVFSKKTIGARALVVRDHKVFLIYHTYVPDWYSIGGAVDKGETPIEAVERELFEEVGIKCTQKPQLFGIYYNPKSDRDDYVVFYIVKDFEQVAVTSPEILKAEWFSLDALPDDLSPGTKRRIEEYLGKREIDERW